jgi:hypothetical protein
VNTQKTNAKNALALRRKGEKQPMKLKIFVILPWKMFPVKSAIASTTNLIEKQNHPNLLTLLFGFRMKTCLTAKPGSCSACISCLYSGFPIKQIIIKKTK